MALATDSSPNDWPSLGGLLALRWAGRVSVTRRILAVNIFALAMLAASFFYLDSYRSRLLVRAALESSHEITIIGTAFNQDPNQFSQLERVRTIATAAHARIRIIDNSGHLTLDAWPLGEDDYGYDNPNREPWTLVAARELDRMVDAIVFAPRLADFSDAVPQYKPQFTTASISYAPDRTPMITAMTPTNHGFILTTQNARDITQTVRDERFRLALIIAAVTLVSILLSLFLARTIALPLRRLARATVRVRLGRDRDVMVPRLDDRSDEIGMLARAVSDMSQALRRKIDASEAFAADVSHELKNPLASLRSAVDSLALVQATELRAQLIGIIREDVHRVDRLVTDIARLSRLDAEMSRTPFTNVDLIALVHTVVSRRQARDFVKEARRIDIKNDIGSAHILGDINQLEQIIDNLLDNALAFGPRESSIRIGVSGSVTEFILWVEDDGPGIPTEDRERVFNRFYSARLNHNFDGSSVDPNEAFHSGLGLAIVRTIIEAHGGTVMVEDHLDGSNGARFAVTFPRNTGIH